MLDRFEKYVCNIKGKMSDRTLSLISFAFIGLIIFFLLITLNGYLNKKQEIADINNKILYDLIGYISNMDAYVEKIRVSSSDDSTILMHSNIISSADLAKNNLGNLPINQNDMGKISKFLTQTSNFSITSIEKISKGEKLNTDDYANLEIINKYLVSLKKAFTEIYYELNKANIRWDELPKKTNQKIEQTNVDVTINALNTLKNNFTEYDGLIYDGAYSNHLETNEPKLIASLSEVSQEEALKKVTEIIETRFQKNNNKEISSIEFVEEINGKIALYLFKVYLDNDKEHIDVEITKQGGLLYLMSYNREINARNMDIESAKEIGRKYLENLGIISMYPTYTLEEDGMVTINYAYKQDDVIIYTDLVKVKVALDTGEVCCLEASGYIFNHTERIIPTPALTKEQARDFLNPNVEPQTISLAIIPTDIQTEVLTYEFKGNVEEREFLIYINANTGFQENVLIILETPGGKLTM